MEQGVGETIPCLFGVSGQETNVEALNALLARLIKMTCRKHNDATVVKICKSIAATSRL